MWHSEQVARMASRSAANAACKYLEETLGVSHVVALGIASDLDNLLRVVGAAVPDREPYQVWHKAVSYREPAGKPLKKCAMVDVALTVVALADTATGLSAHERTKRRILRICQEALKQGAVLSYEDICLLLGLERTTVGKYIRELKKDGYPELTRADLTKSSRNQTHKRIVILMYLSGASELEIVRRVKHSLERVNEYLSTFARVALAIRNGVDAGILPRVCKLSPKLAGQYLEIYAEAQADPIMGKRLDEWVRQLEAPKKGGH